MDLLSEQIVEGVKEKLVKEYNNFVVTRKNDIISIKNRGFFKRFKQTVTSEPIVVICIGTGGKKMNNIIGASIIYASKPLSANSFKYQGNTKKTIEEVHKWIIGELSSLKQ